MINPKVFEIFHKKSLFQQFTDDQYQTRPLLSLVRMIPNNRILDNLSKFVPDKLKIHVMTSQIGVNYSIKTLMKENIFINQQKINDMYEDICFIYEMSCASPELLIEANIVITSTLFSIILLFNRNKIDLNIITNLVNTYNSVLSNPTIIDHDSLNISSTKEKITEIVYLYEHILRISFKGRNFKRTILSKCYKYSSYIANVINELYSDRVECFNVIDVFKWHPLFSCGNLRLFNGITGILGIISVQSLGIRTTMLEFEANVINFILSSKTLYINIISMCSHYKRLVDNYSLIGYADESTSKYIVIGTEICKNLIDLFVKYFVKGDSIKIRNLILKM